MRRRNARDGISRTVSVYLDEDTNNRLIKAKDRSGRSKTIEVQIRHQALLQYIRPGAQNQMKVILAEEAKRIKNDNVNSAFFQTSVRVWPQYGRVEIRGVLKTWIGDSKPFTDIKHYILILKRENGVTWLDNFGETDDEKK
ncbi:TraY domain-containing protein [Escherichia coli]|nr:TraY domain-containing protein [Escherichia coli]